MKLDRSALLTRIDALADEQVAFLAELVRVPSDNPPGDCAAHAAATAALLEARGMTVERHPVPPATASVAGMRSVTNLIVRRRFGDGPVVALNAHGDVVPPGEGWSSDPYGAEIRAGAMYGRGAAVSKSDFATYAFALEALAEQGEALRGTVELHLTYDEETGGEVGPLWLLEQGLSRPDYAICAGFSHGVTIAHNGCLHLEVAVLGKSAHAARPETGVDALRGAVELLRTLYDMTAGFAAHPSSIAGIGHPNLVVGLIEGGINTNVVPDRVLFRLDRRIVPEENPELVEAELVAAIERAAAARPGLAVQVRRILLARPMVPIAGQERLVALVQAHAQEILGEEIPAEGTPIYCDARHYSAAGIPTVLYGAGPRSLLEANGHRADEHLRLADLLAATKVIALTLADLLA